MSLRIPQGYLASGDAYTRRYDEIVKNVPRKIKIIDDTLLFDKNIEDTFYHTLYYLLMCEKNGIVLKREKFQFCLDVVQFGGLQITSSVTPCDNQQNAISSFPTRKNITDARSWFGLVNQVAWAYSLSNSAISGPRQNTHTHTHTLCLEWEPGKSIFQQSKQIIVGLVKKELSPSTSTG